MKKLSNILSWAINILLFGGLAFFTVAFFLRGDLFHAIIDFLYLLIIVSNVVFRHLYNKMKRENESLLEGGKVLVEQNAKLTERLAKINNPFKPMEGIDVGRYTNVKMKVISAYFEYPWEDLTGCSEEERKNKVSSIETGVKHQLLNSIFTSDLISIRHETSNRGLMMCVADFIVGIKGE